MLGLVIATLMISAASAFSVIVHDAEVRVGDTAPVAVEIDEIPLNLSYYKITLTLADPAIGEFVDDVTNPGWTTFMDHSALPSDALWMRGSNYEIPVAAGTNSVPLGAFEVRGDAVGTSRIDIAVNSMETDGGFDFTVLPTVVPGNLRVLDQLSGFVSVTSVPPGAEIWIDNADTGVQTNSTIDGVSPGEHAVKVTLSGYQDAGQNVLVVTGETVNADFVLAPVITETGNISVTSVPPGAEIWIDNADTGAQTNSTIDGVSPGEHAVKLTLSGYQDAEQNVIVLAGETVNADFVLAPVITETGNISVTSVPPEAEIWIDNVDTGAQTNSTIDGVSPGEHAVKLTLSGYQDAEQNVNVVAGETAVTNFYLRRLPEPPVALFLAFPREGTAPLTVLFLDLSSGFPSSREWDFGDGTTSADLFPLHTYENPGRFTVKLTVKNAGGEDTSLQEDFIIVNAEAPPVAQFVAYPLQGTAPLTVLFLDLSSGFPSSREWDFGDGTTSEGLFPLHTYEKPGVYTVKLNVSNTGGTDTLVRQDFITVTAGVPPGAQFTSYPREGTAPLMVTFLDLSTGFPSSREWDFGDGTTSTDMNPIHIYENPGKYSVSLTVTNDAGSDTAVQEDFIIVTAEGLGITGTQEPGGNASVPGEEPQVPVSTQRPQIRIS
ncbi:MAG: PKD domain-containing protein [Methanomicrobiales archaeon]|nr:PKD domain-containing protein [Methanomicrobiales archaeon]